MIQIKEFELADIDRLKPRAVYVDDKGLVERVRSASQSESCAVHTIMNGDEVLCIVGGTLLYPQVMEVWTIISDDVSQFKIAFHKMIMDLIDIYTHRFNLRRMQMMVRGRFEAGAKWAESLGFRRECVLRNYGSQVEEYLLYARLIDE